MWIVFYAAFAWLNKIHQKFNIAYEIKNFIRFICFDYGLSEIIPGM